MASSKSSVKIEGLSELKDALDDFSKSTSGNILKRAVSTAAALFAEEAALRAPKRTGRLKQSIKVGKAKIISAGQAAYASAKEEGASNAEAATAARNANRTAGGTGRQAIVHAGPTKDVRAAVPQEFGTFKMPPHPFMRPAWDSNDVKCAEAIRDALKEEIDKATVRAQKKAAKLLAKS